MTVTLVPDQLRLIQKQDDPFAALCHRHLHAGEEFLGEVALSLRAWSDGQRDLLPGDRKLACPQGTSGRRANALEAGEPLPRLPEQPAEGALKRLVRIVRGLELEFGRLPVRLLGSLGECS